MSDKNGIPPSKRIIIVLSAFCIISIVLHLFTNLFSAYGIFRDELYYIACSKRLDTGYVDQPPFSIYMLYLSRLLFGESMVAIRILPSLFSGITVFLTGLLTRKIGGNLSAVVLSCTAILFAPIFIAMHSVYSMNIYDYFFWVLAIYLIVDIVQSNKKPNWYLLGGVVGLALLNKIGFLWFGAGLFIGLLLTSPSVFRKKEVYISALIAFILFSPFIIWNITHEYAHLEFISNATKYKYSGITRMDFVIGQVLLLNPLSFPLWLAGIYYYMFDGRGKKYRIVGIIYLVSFFILFINGNTKPEYLGPAYAALFTGGAVFFEKLFMNKLKYLVSFVIPGVIAAAGLVLLPIVSPVLPVETFIKYQNAIGIKPGTMEGKELDELPQFYADMFGWENMAKTVSEVYSQLTPPDQRSAIIFAHNYGQAGAIEYYSSKYPLPPVISPHNNFWYWIDEADTTFEIIIVIGGELEEHKKSCESVEVVSIIKNEYAMPYESDLLVYVCRKLKRTIKNIWDESKHFI